MALNSEVRTILGRIPNSGWTFIFLFFFNFYLLFRKVSITEDHLEYLELRRVSEVSRRGIANILDTRVREVGLGFPT